MDTVSPGPPFLAGDHPVALATRAEAARAFWTSVWLGTAVAGGVFGLCVAGAPGLFYGIAAAGIVALPTQLTAAAVVWALECPRFRVALAGLAGAATGILTTVLTYDAAVYDVPFSSAIVLAAGIGLLGAAIAGTLSRNAIRRRLRNLAFSGQRRRHFTFLGSLLRLLVLGGLIAAWVVGGRAVWTARQRALRIMCQDRLGQIWEALEAYHRKHGSLPPPVVTDSQGTPLLSWRVLAAEEHYYDQDFRTGLDFSQPWNSPRNAQFLGELDANWLRCPGASAARPGVTQYVAVVGPNTLWEETQPIRLPPSLAPRLLVVEWPPSDVHWAEPRDLSADELLAWFQAQPQAGANRTQGLLYLDTTGRVGELTKGTDPQTVRRLLTGDSTAGLDADPSRKAD